MGKNQKSKLKKCFTGVVGLIWVTGLLVAGSDSPYMPWINGIGVILFFSASILLGKLFQSFELTMDSEVSSTGCYGMQIFHSSKRKINLTTGILAVSRGSNLFSNTEIGKIGVS
jgi:hypothetical protein